MTTLMVSSYMDFSSMTCFFIRLVYKFQIDLNWDVGFELIMHGLVCIIDAIQFWELKHLFSFTN